MFQYFRIIAIKSDRIEQKCFKPETLRIWGMLPNYTQDKRY